MGFMSSEDEAKEATSTVGNVAVDPALLAQQQNFTNALTAQMNGQGPSVATQMLQNQAQQNAANAKGMAASTRGVNAGLAQRQGLNAAAQANAQAAQQGNVARQQEQMNAQGMIGTQLNTMQSQNMGAQQANQNKDMGAAQLQANASQQSAANNASMFGGAISGAAAALPMLLSDERQKTAVQDGSGDAYQFLESLSPKSFEYKDPSMPGAAPGEQLGVMAQDVPEAAPQAVSDTAQGKMIDPAKAAGPQMAALADLHQRLKRIEGGPVKMAQGGFVDPGMVNHQAMAKGPIAVKSPDVSGAIPSSKPSSALGTQMAGGPMDNPGQGVGTAAPAAMYANKGAVVPGKAKVKGDSIKNDTVSAKLSPGEIVLPRTVANAKNPGKAAMDFVNALLAKGALSSKGKTK